MQAIDNTFDDLAEYHDNLKEYKLNYALTILKSFRNNDDHKFDLTAYIDRNKDSTRVHLSSTTISVYALAQYSDLWRDNQLQVFGTESGFCTLKQYWNFIISVLAKKRRVSSVETPDEFSILNILPLLRYIQCKTFGPTSTNDNEVILGIIESLCNQFADNKLAWEENTHPFIYFKFLMVLDEWQDKITLKMKNEIENYQKKKISEIEFRQAHFLRAIIENGNILSNVEPKSEETTKRNIASIEAIMDSFREKIYQKSKHELYRQMTLRYSGDHSLFDVKRLVYSLLVVSRRSKYSNSLIFKKALNTIFKAQFKTGLLPICHVVNNNFVLNGKKIKHMEVSANPILLSFECYNDMLSDPNVVKLLKEYQLNLGLAIDWIKRQLRKDPSNGQVIGWYPEYECTHMPESWVSSHILIFIKKYCELLSSQTKSLVLKEFGAKSNYSNKLQIIDTYNLRQHIDFIKNPKLNYHSVLLFGPPGTGKTTTGLYLAKELKYNYIEINPTSFLKNGQDNIIPTAQDIFKKLGHINDAVVLFDEIDEPLKERKPERPAWTITAFLPLLSDLRGRKKIKFILATNRITDIDEAAYRHGRIDLVLPVGGISWKYRLILLKQALENSQLPKEEQARILPQKIDVTEQRNLPTHLCNFLRRSNFINQRDFRGLLEKVFLNNDTNKIQKSDMYRLFFEPLKSSDHSYDIFQDKNLRLFHDEIQKDPVRSKIRFPDETKELTNDIISANIII